MFGILDRLYAKSKREIIHEEVDWRSQITVYDNSNESWYCFVPKIVMNNKRIREGILPKRGKIIAYTTSYVNLLVPNAEQTRDNLRTIYENASTRINEDLDQCRQISVLGG